MTGPTQLLAGAEALSAVMAAQQDILHAMRALTRRQQVAILDGDVGALTDVVGEQQQLVEHLNALETERMTALVAIAAATGMEAGTTTLSAVAAALPDEPSRALALQGRELRDEALALQQEQDVNERLIEHSRALVDRWLHYLRSVLGGTLYTATGGTGSAPGGRSLDRSA